MLREATLLKLFCLYSNREIIIPLEANTFILGYNPFQKGLEVQESKHELTKGYLPCKNGSKSTKCIQSHY